MPYLKMYLATLAAFFILDLAWLGWLAKKFYDKEVGSIRSAQPDWLAAGLFYLMFIGMVLYFSVLPSLETDKVGQVLLRGALFGLAVYGTYDLTNKAVLKDWTWAVSVVDILWGMFLCAVISLVGWWVGK